MKRRNKGEGTIRKRNDGRWEGRYLDSSGNVKSIYDTSKQRVREKLNELCYIKNTTNFNNVGGDISLNVYFQHYIEIKRYNIKERSINQIELAYNTHIKPVLGNKILYQININDIITLKRNLDSKDLAESSKNNIMTHLKTLMNFAAKEGMLSQNPFIYLTLNKGSDTKKSTRRNLTDKEIGYILNEAKLAKDYNDRIYIMLCTLIYTGIRDGELCALRWNDFDSNFQYIKIDESHTDSKYETSTKTRSSRRIIPLTNELSNQYKELFEDAHPVDLNDYIFRTKRGNPYTSSMIALRLKFIKEQIRKKYDVDLSEVTPHYFRHTFATRGIANGVPMKDMQELLGHSDTRTLMDVYMHTNNIQKSNSINIIWNSFNI